MEFNLKFSKLKFSTSYHWFLDLNDEERLLTRFLLEWLRFINDVICQTNSNYSITDIERKGSLYNAELIASILGLSVFIEVKHRTISGDRVGDRR